MITRRLLEWGMILAATLIATFLRFLNIGAESLWDGEIFTLLFAHFDWNILLPSISMFSAHPPLWFVLTKLSITGGWNETLLRMPSAFAGIAAVPALYALGKRLLDVRAGLIGAALLALSPMHVLFSQNGRNYAFFVLLVILLIYAATRALAVQDRHRARWWILFGFCGLVGFYTHYLFILPLFGTILAVILRLLLDAVRQTRSGKNVREWGGIALVSSRGFLIALIAIGALYLPWTPTVGSAFLGRQLTREAGQEEEEDNVLSLQTVPRLLKDFSGSGSPGLVIYAALALLGILWAWRSEKRGALFWLGISIALPLSVMVLLAPRRLPAKYLIYVLPAFLLFGGYGITALGDFASRLLKFDRLAPAFHLAALLVLAFASVPNMPYWNGTRTVFTGEGWIVVDKWKSWRDAAIEILAQTRPGDMVLFPVEARALTERSVVPYFDPEFLGALYSKPPQGRVWWVSEKRDIIVARQNSILTNKEFGDVVVQEWQPVPPFREIPLANASFEDGFRDWNKSNALAQWSRDSEIVVDGTASARVTLSKNDNAPLRSSAFPVTAGKMYRVTAYVKNPTFGFYTVSPQLFVTFLGENATPRRTRLPIVTPSDKPGWMLMVTNGIVPANATTAYIEFLFRGYAKTLNPTAWVDNVRIWVEE